LASRVALIGASLPVTRRIAVFATLCCLWSITFMAATDCFGAILQEPSSDCSWPVNAHPETAHRSEKPTISVAQLSLMRRELRFFNFKIANSTPQSPCRAQQLDRFEILHASVNPRPSFV
jgi:hypothetical protein